MKALHVASIASLICLLICDALMWAFPLVILEGRGAFSFPHKGVFYQRDFLWLLSADLQTPNPANSYSRQRFSFLDILRGETVHINNDTRYVTLSVSMFLFVGVVFSFLDLFLAYHFITEYIRHNKKHNRVIIFNSIFILSNVFAAIKVVTLTLFLAIAFIAYPPMGELPLTHVAFPEYQYTKQTQFEPHMTGGINLLVNILLLSPLVCLLLKLILIKHTNDDLSEFLIEAGVQHESRDDFDVFAHSPDSSSLKSQGTTR